MAKSSSQACCCCAKKFDGCIRMKTELGKSMPISEGEEKVLNGAVFLIYPAIFITPVLFNAGSRRA